MNLFLIYCIYHCEKVVLILWLHYGFVCCVDDSKRFATRANDKPHRRRLAGGEKKIRLYEVNAHNILEVVEEAHGFCHMASKNIEGLWYYVSLATHFHVPLKIIFMQIF